jgi:integrase/recombinase XerD
MLRVQRVVMPSGAESATVLRDGVLVEPADRYLAHLTAIERSPNTVRAYAHDLRDYFAFLGSRGLAWDEVSLEELGQFVAWLRLPRGARDGQVTVLPWVEGSVSASTVNRKLSSLASFYEFHQRHGVDVADLLTRWRPGGRGGSWKPFLAHLGSRPERRRAVGLRAERRLPRELSEAEMATLVDACVRLRDQFLLSVLRGCGLRIGEARAAA